LQVSLPGTPVLASVDRERLFQVISNLFDNALKFTPHNGCIRLELSVERAAAVLLIRDTGPGLPQGMEIWKPFQRGDAGEAATAGMGLGLSLVKVIIEAHGGSCTAGSNLPHGAMITIRLPLH
jgi:signal transduction histidine kinase